MPDQPDVPHEHAGTRQPSHKIGTDFQLNEKFVAAVGQEKAQAMMDLLNRVGIEHGDAAPSDIVRHLRDGLDRLGIRVTDVEIDNFADQIARSHRIVAGEDHNPNEAGGSRR